MNNQDVASNKQGASALLYNREESVLAYLQDGLLSLLWSAENICKWIHVVHFPFPSVLVHGKLLHLICIAGIVAQEAYWNIAVCSRPKDKETKPLSEEKSHSILQLVPYGSNDWMKEFNSSREGGRLWANYKHSSYKNKEVV